MLFDERKRGVAKGGTLLGWHTRRIVGIVTGLVTALNCDEGRVGSGNNSSSIRGCSSSSGIGNSFK